MHIYVFLNYVSEQISLDYVRLYAFWLAGDLEHNLSSRFEGSFEDFGLHSPQGLYARYSDPSHRLSPSRSRNAMAGGIGAQALGPLPFSPFQMPERLWLKHLPFRNFYRHAQTTARHNLQKQLMVDQLFRHSLHPAEIRIYTSFRT